MNNVIYLLILLLLVTVLLITLSILEGRKAKRKEENKKINADLEASKRYIRLLENDKEALNEQLEYHKNTNKKQYLSHFINEKHEIIKNIRGVTIIDDNGKVISLEFTYRKKVNNEWKYLPVTPCFITE